MYRKVISSLILYTLTVHQSIIFPEWLNLIHIEGLELFHNNDVLFSFATHFQAIFIHYKSRSATAIRGL